ncbi:MAG: RiPP maturation radical SAM C-methyltransferase [Deltaproteobacteria bacterium]|nr:RiPP maturation radical SAM C-methyltransferase [Deltaproteobacteria bacterium]
MPQASQSDKGAGGPDKPSIRTFEGTRSRLALISSPWPFFDRPSVQLGTLKGFLNQGLPDTGVDTYHLYLQIAERLGYDLYHRISSRLWVAECPYAALLYPERMDTVRRLWGRKTRGDADLSSVDFDRLCRDIRRTSRSLLSGTAWEEYDLIGFSICLAQLSSSLYFIREIKRRAPYIPIVVGGSACAGNMGNSLLQGIPDIDYVIQGEGEIPLLGLMRFIRGGGDAFSRSRPFMENGSGKRPQFSEGPHACEARLNIPGLMSRNALTGKAKVQQIKDLDELPIPDYGDYFRDLKSLDPDRRFLPRLPMEISRGCWWRKSSRKTDEKGCAFCNLNLQWEGYRRKSTERVISEIDALVTRHQVLTISFMDNLLPARGLEALFSGISDLKKDLKLFSEIRADTSHEVLRQMATAGMREVQVGVEALSTRLLKKLNKGTTAMDNLEIMKQGERADMPDLTGNLILAFPSSDAEDVAETLTHVSAGYEYNCRDISSLAESSPILGALHLLRCHLLLPHGDSRYL